MVEARVRYRAWDGTLQIVQAPQATKIAAERALKVNLADRSLFQPSYSTITADSSFAQPVDFWLKTSTSKAA